MRAAESDVLVRCSYSWSLAGGAPPSLGREEPPRAPPRPRPRPPPRPRPRPRNPPRPEPPRPRPLPRYPPDRGLGAPSSSVPWACSRFTSSAESPDCSEQSFTRTATFPTSYLWAVEFVVVVGALVVLVDPGLLLPFRSQPSRLLAFPRPGFQIF